MFQADLNVGSFHYDRSRCRSLSPSFPSNCPSLSKLLSYSKQVPLISLQVVIGTPGTLKRWLTKDRILEPDNLKILVFDEADHMLDQDGFKDDSVRLLREVNRKARALQVGHRPNQSIIKSLAGMLAWQPAF